MGSPGIRLACEPHVGPAFGHASYCLEQLSGGMAAPLPASPRTVGTTTPIQAWGHPILGDHPQGSAQGQAGGMLCPRDDESQLEGSQRQRAHGHGQGFPSPLAMVGGSWKVWGRSWQARGESWSSAWQHRQGICASLGSGMRASAPSDIPASPEDGDKLSPGESCAAPCTS